MLKTERAQLIDAYLETHNQGDEEKDKSRMPISYKGELHRHQVYRIPTRYLIHNIMNGRFRSELLEKESELKRKLDAADDNDKSIFRQLLLEQKRSETEALKADLVKNGQLDPGIITHDGAVINANRRMAILHELYEETKDSKYEYLLVARLPPDVGERDLWKIEAGLQFGRDYRLEYGGVNELIKLREGEKQGLSDKEISIALAGRYTEKAVRDKLDTLKLIDSYLKYIGKKGQYNVIVEQRSLEKFNSLYTSVLKQLKNKHGIDGKEIAMLTEVAFGLIEKTDVSHWDIRELRKIATIPKAANQLKASLIPEKTTDAPKSSEKDIEPNVVREPDGEQLKEAFTSAKEVVEALQDRDKPLRLLSRAKSALDGVDENAVILKEEKAQKELEEINSILYRIIEATK